MDAEELKIRSNHSNRLVASMHDLHELVAEGGSTFFSIPVKPNFITKATKLQELSIRDTPET
jgi:hypothetical protein